MPSKLFSLFKRKSASQEFDPNKKLDMSRFQTRINAATTAGNNKVAGLPSSGQSIPNSNPQISFTLAGYNIEKVIGEGSYGAVQRGFPFKMCCKKKVIRSYRDPFWTDPDVFIRLLFSSVDTY